MNKLKEITNGNRGALGELSRKSGINISALSQYKAGVRTPCFRTAAKIAEAAGLDVLALFPDAYRFQGAADFMNGGAK